MTHDDTNTTREVGRVEILIARICDNEATADDWGEFEARAQVDPGLWRRVASARRDQDLLCAGFQAEMACVRRVDAPDGHVRAAHATGVRVRAWSGWAVAAALGFVLFNTANFGFPSSENARDDSAGVQSAGLVHLQDATPDEAFGRYLTGGTEAGRVIGELPKTMVSTRSLGEGPGVEVLYIRRIYERRIINEVVEFNFDEFGSPTPVRKPARTILVNDPL